MFNRIRNTFKYLIFNKLHWKTVVHSFKSYNWDYYYFYDSMRCKLEEMRDYFSKSDIAIKDYDVIVRDITICIRLIDILTGETQLVKFTSPLKFCKKSGQYTFDSNGLGHDCLVKVNFKNVSRFLYQFDKEEREGYLKIWKQFPEELYMVKARRLLFKILYDKINYWWD